MKNKLTKRGPHIGGRIRSRWLCLLMVLIMTVGLLAGCGDPAGGASQENSAGLMTVTDETPEEDASPDDGSEEAADSGENRDEETEEDEAQAASPSGQEDGAGGEAQQSIDENGSYTSKEDVALYIHIYGRLPSNFITKKEARKLGWEGGSVERYAPGKCIGGSHYGNYEGLLPEGNYKECDIDTLGKKSRGAKRLVYSDDGRIYYTEDHFESFTQLY